MKSVSGKDSGFYTGNDGKIPAVNIKTSVQ